MSPRSEEFMERARDRLALARTALEAGHPDGAVSAAYYAALYAVRAALSEEELYAKTHTGTWNRFRQAFVLTGRFDSEALSEAERWRDLREGADYEAAAIDRREAEDVVSGAEGFVAAVGRLIEG